MFSGAKKLYHRSALVFRYFSFRLADLLAAPYVASLRFQLTDGLGGGHNAKFLARDQFGRKWVVKFCRNTIGRVPDICEREALAFLFGRLLGVPVIHARVVSRGRIKNPPVFGPEFVSDKCVLVPYISSKNLNQCSEQELKSLIHTNRNSIRRALTFYHWYGDEDRGGEDVMARGDRLRLIDHGLSGPGHDQRLRSAHPHPDRYQAADVLRKSYPGKANAFTEIVAKYDRAALLKLGDLPFVTRLEVVPDFIISSYVDSSLSGIAGSDPIGFKAALKSRRDSLKQDVALWSEEFLGIGQTAAQ